NFLDRSGDLAAHERAGQDERHRAGQPRHGAHRVGQVLLADDGNGVDTDLLATDVVAIGLSNRAERNLPHLRTTTDDNDAFAKDFEHARDTLDPAHHVEALEVGNERVLVVDAIEFPENRAAVAP